MLRRGMKFRPIKDTFGFCWRTHVIEASGRMRVKRSFVGTQSVFHAVNQFRIRLVRTEGLNQL